jgi:hypothetical protein
MTVGDITTIIVSTVVPITTAAITYFNYKRSVKKDTKNEGQEKGILLTEIGYIKSGVDRIDKRTEQLDLAQSEQGKEIAKLEAIVNAHLNDYNSHNYKVTGGRKKNDN